MEDVIGKFDSASVKGFNEVEYSEALRAAAGDLDKESNQFYELTAFQFVENYPTESIGHWGTYFGPAFTSSTKDGKYMEAPSISHVTGETIGYWEARCHNSKNPLIKSRFLGLVWDFKKKITGDQPHYHIAEEYVKNLLIVVNENYCRHCSECIDKIERSLQVARSLKNPDLIDECVKTILGFDQSTFIQKEKYCWTAAFDTLIAPKAIKDEEAIKNVIDLLHQKVNLLVAVSDKDLDPWSVQHLSERLAQYYRRIGDIEAVRGIISLVGDCFRRILSETPLIQQHAWLDNLHKLYISYNLKDLADEVLVQIRTVGKEMELQEITTEIDVPREEIDTFIAFLLDGDSQEILHKIGLNFLPNKDSVINQIRDLAEKYPMQYILSEQILDQKGRIVSRIDSLEDDMEGNVIRQISRNLGLSSLILHETLVKAKALNKLTSGKILDFLKDSPIIDPDRFRIIEKGVQAAFEGDYLQAIHLLIPQIEEAIRNALEGSGGLVLKQSRGGGHHLRTFDEILRDPKFESVVTQNTALYLRILFTDQRGWNIRNDVCHGQMPLSGFNYGVCDRLIHALICIGAIERQNEDEKEENAEKS